MKSGVKFPSGFFGDVLFGCAFGSITGVNIIDGPSRCCFIRSLCFVMRWAVSSFAFCCFLAGLEFRLSSVFSGRLLVWFRAVCVAWQLEGERAVLVEHVARRRISGQRRWGKVLGRASEGKRAGIRRVPNGAKQGEGVRTNAGFARVRETKEGQGSRRAPRYAGRIVKDMGGGVTELECLN